MPIRVVNVIPQFRSGETNFDSEPSIAVNPSNPRQVVLTSFTPDTGAVVTTGSYFFSTDGGQTWAMNSVIPGGNSVLNTGDISVRFGGSSGVLYAGILRADTSLQLNILRKANFAGPGLMQILISRASVDQPWVEAATQSNTDRVYVSLNDVSQRPTGRTASVDVSVDAATAPPPGNFTTTPRLEFRTSALLPGGAGRQDGPSARTAIHRSGVVYASFMGWRTFGSPNVSDIVVTRDDNWGVSAAPFQALVDAGDGVVGRRIVTAVSIAPLGTLLGTQRVGSSLTMAVDPRNARRVYIAWSDGLATAASPYTIHVRRSDNGGQTWTGDLFTVANATNQGLAVNNQGVVAMLYQQLVSVAGVNRWRTHLVRSTDHFATVATDNTLADVLDSSAGATLSVIIGDYANLIAIGKDFYGAFSAHNLPANANFPSGVTYLRNANFATQQLLAVNNVTPVAASVDPFFVHFQTVRLEDDFFVRDWTDSPTSFDTGVEPSIKPAFYVTPDVWNRRGTLPGAFPNDQPENENAGNGLGNVGDNFLFARIRRRAAAAAGSPAVTVRAHFLVSKLGTGSNYVDATSVDPDVVITAGDPTVTFAAADVGPKTTAALPWHLNPIASTHLCAAVEISTPADPFVGDSLRGRAPGWPDQDLEIVDDNNKAQRNMGLSTTAARGVGLSAFAHFAIVHNAATFVRDFSLRFDVDETLRRRVRQVSIETIGGTRPPTGGSGTIVLKAMQPGENRWIGVRFQPPKGKEGEVLPVLFDELLGGSVVSGFGLGVRLGSPKDVALHTLWRYLSVFIRLGAMLKLPIAEKHVEFATRTLREISRSRNPVAPTAWLATLRADATFLDEVRRSLGARDPFGTAREAASLRKLLTGTSDDDTLVCFTAYLERVDSHLTMTQLEAGDRADIHQNIRWQVDVIRRLPETSVQREVESLCVRFLALWGERRASERDYPPLVQRLIPLLQKLAAELGDQELQRRVEDMNGNASDLDGLQGRHRRALLQIQSHVKP